MGAAVIPAENQTLASREEMGRSYWERLNVECESQARAVNAVLLKHGDPPDRAIVVTTGNELRLTTTDSPSTRIYARLGFRSWGPVISATIDCYEADGARLTEEFEVPVAEDVDGEIVGLFDQGRSVCACELAAYLLQHFNHCYPSVTLPCPERFV
jgi:hypothetical protein